MKYDITATIVLFRNDPDTLKKAIDSFLATPLSVRLYLVDNSPDDRLKSLATSDRIEYIFNNKNIGFGSGHNVGIRKSLSNSKYHLVLNPDVYFSGDALSSLFQFMEANEEVGQVMPQIRYPDGSIQFSAKLLPTPLNLFSRRVFKNLSYFKRLSDDYELKNSGYNRIMNVPHHLGCFMFLRTSALREVGIFDEKMFMYLEDTDLTRRIHRKFKTLFYPDVEIFHTYEKGSRKQLKLLKYHVDSAIVYFNKWGWISDPERDEMNKAARLQ